MMIPIPKFSKGDSVMCLFSNRMGTVLSRSYNNLVYQKYWQYEVEWNDDSITNHHFCYDLYKVNSVSTLVLQN